MLNSIRKKGFTLVELIIIIIVLGLLVGLAVPKFIGVSRDAQVATLYQDMDVLKKAIDVYFLEKEEYPLKEKVSLLPEHPLFSVILGAGDSNDHLYKVDLKKSGIYHTKLKHGYEKEKNDYFLYSLKTGNLYYAKGILNNEGKFVFSNYPATKLRNVVFGSYVIKEERTIEMEAGIYTLSGEVLKGSSVSVYFDGKEVPVEYESTAFRGYITQVYAGDTPYTRFKAHLMLKADQTHKIEIVVNNETENRFQIKAKKPVPPKIHGVTDAVLDNDPSTRMNLTEIKPAIITWDGDLTYKVVQIDAMVSAAYSTNKGRMFVEDKDGNRLPFYLGDGTFVEDSISMPQSRRLYSVIIPEGAASIVIQPTSGTTFLYDIKVNDILPTLPVSNGKAVPRPTSVELSWTNPDDENLKEIWIFRNGEKIAAVTGNSYHDKALWADTEYTYEIRAVDNTGNLSEPYLVTLRTLPREIVWHGSNPSVFDGFSDTQKTLASKELITWDGDLSGKTVAINIAIGRLYSGSQVHIFIQDENGNNLPFYLKNGTYIEERITQQDGQITHEIIMPEKAAAILIQSERENYVLDIYEEGFSN